MNNNRGIPRVTYHFKQANYTILCREPERVQQEIRRQWSLLEAYIRECPQFADALQPLPALPGDPPESARRMHRASLATGEAGRNTEAARDHEGGHAPHTEAARAHEGGHVPHTEAAHAHEGRYEPSRGVGPMAAVAGTIAQLAAEAGGDRECIVDNGGDLYLIAGRPLVVGLYVGEHMLSGNLGFRVLPEMMPCALCSSSSRMGHSLSFGSCDLVTVISPDGSLADAAATFGCNLVHSPDDISRVAELLAGIEGIWGALIVSDENVALAGDLPELIKPQHSDVTCKVTRDRQSSFPG